MTKERIGRYDIQRELGRGGMATVFLAFDPSFAREVAIKVLPRNLLHDPQFHARFEREARTIATLEHPSIVPVYDFGEDDDQPYLVMRYMHGGSLTDRLKGKPLSIPETVRIFNQIAAALDLAHAKGLVHRDLKPSNILFDQAGNAYVADFGIVKISDASIQYTQGIIGTPAYMSPEQARGDEQVDRRSDIYALGTILFEMLTGKQPYQSDTPMGLALAHVTEPVPRILEQREDLPPEAEAIIDRAMAKEPDSRFSTASALADAISNMATSDSAPAPGGAANVVEPAPPMPATVVEPVPTVAPASGVVPAPTHEPKRGGIPRWLLGLGCGLVLLIAIVGGIGLLGGGGVLLLAGLGASTPTPTQTPAPTRTSAPAPTFTPILATATAAPAPTIAVVLSSEAPEVSGTRITVLNAGTLNVCYVYISPSSEDSWGTDQLGNATIPSGVSEAFPVEPGVSYDLRVDECNDRNIAAEFGVMLADNKSFPWTVANEIGIAQVTLFNQGEAAVCFVNYSQTTADAWGPDRLATNSIISTGGQVTFDIPSAGTYDFRAQDCDRNALNEIFDQQIVAGDDLSWDIGP